MTAALHENSWNQVVRLLRFGPSKRNDQQRNNPTIFRRQSLAQVLLLGCALQARAALACPVCFSQANENVLKTYYLTTVLLSLLPLLILASIGTWLYRRQRAAMNATEPC